MFAKLHVCPQLTQLPLWFSTSHGEITVNSRVEKYLEIAFKKKKKK